MVMNLENSRTAAAAMRERVAAKTTSWERVYMSTSPDTSAERLQSVYRTSAQSHHVNKLNTTWLGSRVIASIKGGMYKSGTRSLILLPTFSDQLVGTKSVPAPFQTKAFL